ncbi:MAG: hypothetical protein WCP70_06475 [Methanothrix sp.]
MENMFFSLEKLRPGHAKVLAGNGSRLRVRERARVPREYGRARGGLSEKLTLFFYDPKSTLVVVSVRSSSAFSATLRYNFVTPRV